MSNPSWFHNLPRLIFWIVMLVMTILFLAPQQFVSSPIFDWWDKAQHALAFGVLMLLGFLAYPRAFWKLTVALILYGIAIEVIQSLTGWRYGDMVDILADMLGVILFASLIRVLQIRKRYRIVS